MASPTFPCLHRLPVDVLRHVLLTGRMLDSCSLLMVRFSSRLLLSLCCPPFAPRRRTSRQQGEQALPDGPGAAAARRGYWNILRWLRRRFGPDILKSDRALIRLAIGSGADIALVDWLRTEGEAVLAEADCHAAVGHGNLAMLQHLLPLVPTARNGTLLFLAARGGDVATVQCVPRKA